MSLFEKCRNFTIVEEIIAQGIYPYFTTIESAQLTKVIVNGKELIMVGSNNYLGLTMHDDVINAAVEATRKYGSGCTGSRFLNGNLDLHAILEEELARAARFGHRVSLIMLDIDDFKDFNDSYGHPRGDKVLRIVSNIIRENLREMDMAARYGGEEFVLILPETPTEGAYQVAERIRVRVAEFPFAGGEGLPPVHKSISMGVAAYPDDAGSPGTLIELADRAMYHAKREGKNCVSVPDDLSDEIAD